MLALIAMENRVKEVTRSVLNELNRARIRSIMVTGDNLLTALSVARECGIVRPTKRTYILEHTPNERDEFGRTKLVLKQSISSSDDIVEDFDEGNNKQPFEMESNMKAVNNCTYHIAIAGSTYTVICHEYPELVSRLACVCDVFARMSPDQKQLLVESLQDVAYTVAMCGDGANDCAALKAAHAGISLSDSEASIAAPFTSKVADIRCVPRVISEGRAALVTSFGIFKYMAGYSLTQFFTVIQLYSIQNILTDGQVEFPNIDYFEASTIFLQQIAEVENRMVILKS
ncbi:hypothetical protein WR25_25555 isoform A [Diploscapter pachys]|uniref:Cation-transporting P-type ATPase C-terminal domain-containing protein n=1 Tax=Diploscapter pachys TaxID=2018661 RepID=A0A2A2M1W5_9BILA|nr:hypothetical protein WR25_25555 isoform A [Diploscapter pachys]